MNLNEFVKEHWFTLIGITICIVIVIYTPAMIDSSVNECNNYWLEKQQEQNKLYPIPDPEFNMDELPDNLFVRDD